MTAHQVAPGRVRSDNEKMGYGHTSGRVQNQISRRVRDATPPAGRTGARADPRTAATAAVPGPALAAASPAGFLLSLRKVRVPGRLALDRLDVSAADRLLVTGANGAGKSTLLAVLAGGLDAAGEVRRRAGLRVGLLAQDTVFDRPDRTAREIYERALGPGRAASVPLGSLGLLGPSDLGRRVGELSAGQRRRLALALLVADPPEVLLLDEPTNHLSPPLRRTGGGPGHEPRRHRGRQPRPVAASALAGP